MAHGLRDSFSTFLFGPTSRDRVREKRVERAASAVGLRLVRSPARDPSDPSFETFAVIDPARNTLLLADEDSGYGVTLDDAEKFVGEIGLLIKS